MISGDLIKDFKTTIKAVIGQLEHVSKSIGNTNNPEEVLLKTWSTPHPLPDIRPRNIKK